MISVTPACEMASKLIQEAELLLMLQERPHPSRTPRAPHNAGPSTTERAGPLTSLKTNKLCSNRLPGGSSLAENDRTLKGTRPGH